MALLDFEGFDNIKSGTTEPGNFNSASIGTTATNTVFGYGKHFGGTFTSCTIPFPSQLSTFFVNFHYKTDNQAATMPVAQFRDNTTNDQLYVGSDAGKIVVKRGSSSGTTLATSSMMFPFISGVWHFVQIKVVIDNSAGVCIVKVDDVEHINVSGVDTQASASNTYCDAIYWGFGSTAGYADNYVLYDTTGGVFDDFTDETRVRGQKPNGNGDTVQWTPLSSTNVSNVDEEYDADTTYCSTTGVGNIDLYAYAANSPATATIHGVKVGMTFRKDDAGANTDNIIVRSNSTNYEDSAGPYTALSTYVYKQWMMTVDPNTSAAWVYTSANALQNGIIRKA